MKKSLSCDEIRPLLFDYRIRPLPVEKRNLIHAHLAICSDCLAEERSEEALSRLLRSSCSSATGDSATGHSPARPAVIHGPRRWQAAVAAAGGVLLVALVGSVLMTDRASPLAYGSITRYDIGRLPWHGDLETPHSTPPSIEDLQASNYMKFDPGSWNKIILRGAGSMTVAGPAILDLSLVEERWTVAVLQGQLNAAVDSGAQIAISTNAGHCVLEAGSHEVLAAAPDPHERGADERDAHETETPARLLDKGFGAFYEREEMQQAEAHFRTVLEHPDITPAQRTQAGFYLVACLGRQHRHEDALSEGGRWLAENPDDNSRGLLIFFQGVYHQRLGQNDAARKSWEELVDQFPEAPITVHAREYLDGLE